MSRAEPYRSRSSGPKLPSRRTAMVLAGVTVGAYAVVLASMGIGDALPALTRAAALPLIGALSLEVATIATLAMVHRTSATAVGHRLRYGEALNISMTAFTLTQAVPGGGAVAGAEVVRRLTRLGLPGPFATASLALTATLTTTTIGLVGVGGVAVSVLRGDLGGRVLLGAGVALCILIAVFVGVMVVIRSPTIGARLIERLGRVNSALGARAEQWGSSFDDLSHDPPRTTALVRIVAWSAVNWAADIAALWLVFVALGQTVTVAMVLVGFAAAQLGAAIPITPGGTGFVEGGMVAAFVAIGVPFTTATVAVVAYRVLATWMPMLAGLPALFRPPGATP